MYEECSTSCRECKRKCKEYMEEYETRETEMLMQSDSTQPMKRIHGAFKKKRMYE